MNPQTYVLSQKPGVASTQTRRDLSPIAGSFPRSSSVTTLINDDRTINTSYLSPYSAVHYDNSHRQHNQSLNENGTNKNSRPNLLSSVSFTPASPAVAETKNYNKTFSKIKSFFKNENKFTSYISNGNNGKPISLGTSTGTDSIKKSFDSTASLNDLIINSPYNTRPPVDHVKLITNSKTTSQKFVHDAETKENIKRMFNKLPVQDQIELQQRCFDLLKDQYNNKLLRCDELQSEMNELKNELGQIQMPIKSSFEIEKLKSEIRELTNKKFELEIQISKNAKWTCKKCTFCSNPNHLIKCSLCDSERDESEILICTHCNTKNSLINRQCSNCDSFFISPTENNQSKTTATTANRRMTSSLSNGTLSPSHHNNNSPNMSTLSINSNTHSNGAIARSPTTPTSPNTTSQFNPISHPF